MKPLLCVTVTALTTRELRTRRDEIADADLIELRLDSVADPDVAGALAGRRRPVVVTCRPRWEGGAFDGSEEERRRLLTEALALGADYVDLEWRARSDVLMSVTRGHRIVLSMHDYQGVPRDLADQVQAMRATGADVVKVAVRPRCLHDCLPLLDIGRARNHQAGLVLIGMSEYGLVTRVLPARFGSMWTYAGLQSDVGQLTASSLLEEFRFRDVSDATRVYGLVGQPVAHSVSPAMHNAAFREARLDAVYLPLPAADADDFITFARALGIDGASVTTPFKVPLFERIGEASAAARRIGAINTIRMTNGHWTTDNTDASGFLQSLGDRMPLAGIRASVLGAGGAARAVAIALGASGAVVTVHARKPNDAEQVAGLASGRALPWPPAPGAWDLLVNCTPIGMHPHVDETPIRADRLTGRAVYDLVYNPPTTRLLREAAAVGLETIGGLEMLVEQARQQFHMWTGVWPSAGVMREAALKRLSQFEVAPR
jgi:3-dehydroquinate dehydratase/shikimate dehydrogenase